MKTKYKFIGLSKYAERCLCEEDTEKLTEITALIRQKTILVCADLLLEMLDDGRKLNPNGKVLSDTLSNLLEVTYKDKKISGNDTMQAAKDKILYNIYRHFKL